MLPTETPLPAIEDRISFLVHRISAQMARICNPIFRHLKVDIVISRMLVVLLEKGNLPAGDLVRVMALPQSTISHQIKRLAALGYVTRTPDTRDSRIVMIALTSQGREVAERCNALSREVTGLIVEALGPDDTAIVRAALKRADARLASYR